MRPITSEIADTPSQINPVLSIVKFNPTGSSEFAALVPALLLTSNWTQNSKMCNLILDFRPKLPNSHSNSYDMQMKIKVSVQLNRLEKVIDRSTADGGDGSYRLQSLMVLHVTVMEFLLQTMVTSKSSIKFYGTVWNGLKRFIAVCMIVSKHCQPLPTAKAVFAGGSGETNQAFNPHLSPTLVHFGYKAKSNINLNITSE
ncbi:hypothetical protein YC2023_005301 [Brassica napus]